MRLHGARPRPNPGQGWRSLIAGVAAYAIALQAAFAGFVAGSHIALAAVVHQSAICAASAAGTIPAELPDRQSPDHHDGSLCGLACALTGAATAADTTFLSTATVWPAVVSSAILAPQTLGPLAASDIGQSPHRQRAPPA